MSIAEVTELLFVGGMSVIGVSEMSIAEVRCCLLM